MREAAGRRQQLELEHEQALAVLSAKQQEIDFLQKVSRTMGVLGGTAGWGLPPSKQVICSCGALLGGYCSGVSLAKDQHLGPGGEGLGPEIQGGVQACALISGVLGQSSLPPCSWSK